MSFFSSALNDSLWGCRNPLTNLLIFWKKSPTEASAVPILLLSGKSTGCKERRRQNPTDQATFLHFAVSCVILFMEEKGRERIGGTENADIYFGRGGNRTAHGNSGGSLLFLYSEKRSIKGKSALESGCGLPCFVSLRFCGACLRQARWIPYGFSECWKAAGCGAMEGAEEPRLWCGGFFCTVRSFCFICPRRLWTTGWTDHGMPLAL